MKRLSTANSAFSRIKYLFLFVMATIAITSSAQVIELAVGQGTFLYTPAAPYPYTYVSSAVWYDDEAPNIGYAEAPNETYAHVGVISAFSGLQKIKCIYVCSGFVRGKKKASPPLKKTYYIKCLGGGNGGSGGGTGGSSGGSVSDDFQLPYSITMGVGQQLNIADYVKTNYFGVAWEYDSSIAFVSSSLINQAVTQTANGNAILNAVGAGTFVLKATEIGTGKTTSCTITVPEPKVSLAVWTSDESVSCFSFKDKPEVTFVGNNLMVNTTTNTISLPKSLLVNLTFVDESIDELPTTGIQSIQADSPKALFEGNIISFTSCPVGTKVMVCEINGKIVDEFTSNNDGKLIVDLNRYQHGAYIVKCGKLTYKVMRR